MASVKGYLSWDRFHYEQPESDYPVPMVWNHPRGRIDLPLNDVKFSFLGMSLSEQQGDDYVETLLLIPYATIVIPLLLLSTWLLVTRPTTANPTPMPGNEA